MGIFVKKFDKIFFRFFFPPLSSPCRVVQNKFLLIVLSALRKVIIYISHGTYFFLFFMAKKRENIWSPWQRWASVLCEKSIHPIKLDSFSFFHYLYFSYFYIPLFFIFVFIYLLCSYFSNSTPLPVYFCCTM